MTRVDGQLDTAASLSFRGGRDRKAQLELLRRVLAPRYRCSLNIMGKIFSLNIMGKNIFP